MLKPQVEKVDNRYQQMGNINRELEALRKNRMEI